MGHKLFMNPRAPSSALATLGALQPGALRFIKSLCPLVSVSNLYLCMYVGHGFKLSPVIGKILTELVLDQPSSYDLSRFKMNRFQKNQAKL